MLNPSGQNRQKFGTQNTVPYCQKYTPHRITFSSILPTGMDCIFSVSIILHSFIIAFIQIHFFCVVSSKYFVQFYDGETTISKWLFNVSL